jgi:hypothetical protein
MLFTFPEESHLMGGLEALCPSAGRDFSQTPEAVKNILRIQEKFQKTG